MPFSTALPLYRKRGAAVEALTLTLLIDQEDQRWVGVCHELGTSAYSATLESALEELKEAVALQLNEMDRLGHLEAYLRDRHVQVSEVATQAEGEWAAASVSSTA